MKKLKIKEIIALVLGGLIFILTLLRENLFLEINAIMDGHTYNQAYFYFLNESISTLNFRQLSILKWGLTVAFIGFIAGLTILVIHLWFTNKKHTKNTLLIYVVACFIIGVIGLFFMATGTFDKYYFIVRKLIGLVQSPLPLFLFFTMYQYLKKNSV